MFYCPASCSSFVLYCVVIVCSRTTVETSHKALLWFDPTWVSLLSCIFNNQINSLAIFHSQLMLGAGPPSGSCTWTIKPLTATPRPVWRLSIYIIHITYSCGCVHFASVTIEASPCCLQAALLTANTLSGHQLDAHSHFTCKEKGHSLFESECPSLTKKQACFERNQADLMNTTVFQWRVDISAL